MSSPSTNGPRPTPEDVRAATRLAHPLAAKHDLATIIGEVRAARSDLITPAHYELPPVPVSLTAPMR